MNEVLVVLGVIALVVLGPIALIFVFGAGMWLVMLLASPTNMLFEGSTDPFWDLFGGRPKERRQARALRDRQRWDVEVDDIYARGPRSDVRPIDRFDFDDPDLTRIEWLLAEPLDRRNLPDS